MSVCSMDIENISMGCTNIVHEDLDSDCTPNIPFLYSQAPQLLSNVIYNLLHFVQQLASYNFEQPNALSLTLPLCK